MGPRADVLGVGVIFLLVGTIGTAGLLPLAFLGLNTVSVTNTDVIVTSTGSVSYDTTLTSNWNESINIEVWGQVKSHTGVIMLGPTLSTTNLGAFETQTISGPLGFLTPSQNGYKLELYIWSSDPGWTAILAPKVSVSFRVAPEVTITIIPATIGGSTSPTPGAYPITIGSSLVVTAIPNSPFIFEFWEMTEASSNDILTTQSNPFTVRPDQDMSIQAFFKDTSIPFETLVIRTEGLGTTNPPPGTYSDVYKRGDDSVLTAIPDQGQELKHWQVVRQIGGDFTDPKNSIVVSVDSYTTVTAVFETVIIAQYDVNINIFPEGAGTTNHGVGTMQFNEGETIRFVADANTGYTFYEWSINGETGWVGPIEVTMDREFDITAIFEGGNWYALNIFTVQDGRVSIEQLEGETKGLLSGQTVYTENSLIKLTATPSTNWEFVQWTIGPGEETTETSNTIILKMTQNYEATAQFKQIPEGDPKTDEGGITSVLFPVSMAIGIIAIIGSFFVPGSSRIGSGGRFGGIR